MPTAREGDSNLWDLGPQPKGLLTFTFVCDPAEYKKELSKIAKEVAQAEAAGKPIKSAAQLKPALREPINSQALLKPVVS